MVLKRSKYGLNTGNSIVNPSTDRARGSRSSWNSNGVSARIVKRIVIPTTSAAGGNQQQLSAEQKRQLIAQIESQLASHDGGMQSAIVHTTCDGHVISAKCAEQMLADAESEKAEQKQRLDANEQDENQPPAPLEPLCVVTPPKKKLPHGACIVAPLPQPNVNRDHTTPHFDDIEYSGNKKKRWELMEEVKEALHASNIDLNKFRGKIVAYTSVPVTVDSKTDGISTFVVANNTEYGVEQQLKRVGKNSVISVDSSDDGNKAGIDNAGENNNANTRKQPKKSKRTKNQSKQNNVDVGSKGGTPVAPGIRLVYEFVEPLPKNNSVELGKRSYWSSKCYNGGYGSTSRMYKAQDAIAKHLDDERLVLNPVNGSSPLNVAEKPMVEQQYTASAPGSAVAADDDSNSVWGFISAALKKEARNNRTELNRAGWIVLDIMQATAADTSNNTDHNQQPKNNDDDSNEDDFEAVSDDDDDDDVSSDTFEKPSNVVADDDEEEAEGFVLFDINQLASSTS